MFQFSHHFPHQKPSWQRSLLGTADYWMWRRSFLCNLEAYRGYLTLHCITAYTHTRTDIHTHTHITYIHTHANMHTLHYITLQYSTLPYVPLQYSALHYGTVHCITVLCITLQYCALHYSTVHCNVETVFFLAYMQKTMRIQCGKQRMCTWIEMRIDKMAIWTTMNGKCM